MANYNQIKSEIINYIYARTPLVVINSNERQRVERILYEIVREKQINFLYYTDSKQVVGIGQGVENQDTEEDPLGFFLNKIKRQRHLNIVIGDVRRVSDDNLYSRELMNLLYLAKENNGVVVLITADPIWNRISSFGMIANLDLPNAYERKEQINKFIKTYGSRFTIQWDTSDIHYVTTILRGFTEMQIENILSSEIIGNKGLFKEKIYRIGNQKQKLYPKVGAVHFIDCYRKYDVAGMDNLKIWLEEKKKIFFMAEDTLNKFDLKAPKGILLVGVPGCGKSLSAKLVAQEWDLPLFRFDIGSVFDKWVGESEKKMREALQFIDNVSPCVLWIDEIEKVLATTDNGNETGKRVLGEFLFWIQESSSKVFMVATANNVKVLPYELYRKGRFTEVFYSGLPNNEERKNVLLQYIKLSLDIDIEAHTIDNLVQLTKGYSYADIEMAVKEVAEKVVIYGKDFFTIDRLVSAVKAIIPISKINPELVTEIEMWGKEKAVDVSDTSRR